MGKLTNILFFSFFLMSSLYSIKLSKNKAFGRRHEGPVQSSIDLIRKVDREIEHKDQRIAEELVSDKLRADEHKDRFLHKMEEQAHESNRNNFDLPNVAKESFKALHSGKAEAGQFVHNIDNEFRQRDASNFRRIEHAKKEKLERQNKFLDDLSDKVKRDDRRLLSKSTLRNAEKALTGIHLIRRSDNSSFVETHQNETSVGSIRHAPSIIGKMVNDTNRMIEGFQKRNDQINEDFIKPKEQQFKKEIELAKQINTDRAAQGKQAKNSRQHYPFSTPLPEIPEMIDNAKYIISNIQDRNEIMNKDMIKPKEQKWQNEIAIGDQVGNAHMSTRNREFKEQKEFKKFR